MYTSAFTQLGLSKETSEIYQSLLKNGPQSAIGLSKSTSVKRTYIYAITATMIKQGLISEEKQGRGTLFRAQSPDKLLELAESQRVQADQTKQSLDNILPSLKSMYSLSENKPVVTYYEGPEGVMKANMQILEEKQPILAYLVINKKIDQAMEKYWNTYYQKRISDNIHVRAITTNTPEGIAYQQRDKQELRITKLVPKDKFPFTIEKNICGNKVAFFSMQNQGLIATIIENQDIANSERAFFELAWLQATKYSQS